MDALDVYTILRYGRDRLFSLVVGSSFEHFGKGSRLGLPIQVEGSERIQIGGGVLIGPGSLLAAHPPDGRLEIGDGTHLASGYCVLSAVLHVRVGRNVLFGRNVHVADHRHGFGYDARVRVQPLEDRRPVSIEDGCWLGQNVIVLPGVTIGAGAVIGANSVVREDVLPRSVAVGAPARVVRVLDERLAA